MSYDLTGKIEKIQEAQTFASGFTKRELVVTVEDGKYPQSINLEFLQDKASLLDGLEEGDEVKVYFDIRGREYNGRYFNNMVGWKLEVSGKELVNENGKSCESDRPKLVGDCAEDPDGLDSIPF